MPTHPPLTGAALELFRFIDRHDVGNLDGAQKLIRDVIDEAKFDAMTEAVESLGGDGMCTHINLKDDPERVEKMRREVYGAAKHLEEREREAIARYLEEVADLETHYDEWLRIIAAVRARGSDAKGMTDARD